MEQKLGTVCGKDGEVLQSGMKWDSFRASRSDTTPES